MNCPEITRECPENPDKGHRTDTRARIRNPDICPSGFPSGFALSVSGSPVRPVCLEIKQPVEVHGIACMLQSSGDSYVVTLRASGQRIAAAPTRFLAVARAALNLAPARAFAAPQQGAQQ